ncbi:MAG: tRNA pseudouridine(54/55) synthase Pus10 [Candidatus Lokiarchaeota archaeon]|nr:tRNA pseudouridine(54/55) synthase Pus10 [Candidatus Lokiarchaeota archaeon]
MTSIYDKVLTIYKEKYLCSECLGRLFALLGTSTTNKKRGTSLLLSLTMENHAKYLTNEKEQEKIGIEKLKTLAEKARYPPAQRVLEKEGVPFNIPKSLEKCHLCDGLFLNLSPFVEKAKGKMEGFEFANFLVGTSLNPKIINREDILKSKFNLINSESFKSHFNRRVGKLLAEEFRKPVEFANPEITFIFKVNLNDFELNLIIKSLFIFGRYNKMIRNIPQTHWLCKKCHGKGCEACEYKGKMYETSVEELISLEFVKAAEASGSKFHGAGREDIDVRMLGKGRPFVIELLDPKKRELDLSKIQDIVNQKNPDKVKIRSLRLSNKDEVISIKAQAEDTKKVYSAIVESSEALERTDFNQKLSDLKLQLENKKLDQRTPIRVSHRRADKIREKNIFDIKGEYLDSKSYKFEIKTQGGTYIKELIDGDGGRTSPSFSEIFGMELKCKKLDVIEIFY